MMFIVNFLTKYCPLPCLLSVGLHHTTQVSGLVAHMLLRHGHCDINSDYVTLCGIILASPEVGPVEQSSSYQI